MNPEPTPLNTPAAQPDPTVLRQRIDAAVAAADSRAATALLRDLWHTAPTGATAAFAVARFEQLRPAEQFPRKRVAILRSFTVEPLVPVLRAMAFVAGIDLDVRIGEFNSIAQELIDPKSWLTDYKPDVVILAAQTRDLAPRLWEEFADLSPADAEAEASRLSDTMQQWIERLRSRTGAHVIVHNFQKLPRPAAGVLDAQSPSGQAALIERVNANLLAAARTNKNVYVLDYDALVARYGSLRWEDAKKWLTVRLPIAAEHHAAMAREWLRYLHPICGRACKCLVVDLDNTLWGGVIGEDGIDGIRLDNTSKGAAYQAVQRELLNLYRRGVILAIASKNNLDDAKEVLDKHAGMLVRAEHFAAFRINWNDKATSLREIAQELNIGIDSLAFLDDNPVERQWVGEQVPEATVIPFPDDPMQIASAIAEAGVFERLSLTDEDRERGRMYVEQRVRSEMRAAAGSLEDFYRSLDMAIEIAAVTPATLARTAQLTQKTNQFNLTTKRYSEQDISALIADPACRVYTLSAKDRMGDNGLVGVAITRDRGAVCEVDSLLMSCRVIGRTIETAFIAQIASDARQRGATSVEGWFKPTKKNAPAKDFYAQHGFVAGKTDGDATLWHLSLSGDNVPQVPQWIQLTLKTGATPI